MPDDIWMVEAREAKEAREAENLKNQTELTANLAKLVVVGIAAEDITSFMKNISTSSTATNVLTTTTSKTHIPVPKIQAGMLFGDFKDLVSKWECMTDLPKEKRAMCIAMELPLTDKHGSLQRAVNNKFKNEELMVKDGVKILMDFLYNTRGKFFRQAQSMDAEMGGI